MSVSLSALMVMYFLCLFARAGALVFKPGPVPSQAVSVYASIHYLNRFDAVSAYMRKMDHYGLSDF